MVGKRGEREQRVQEPSRGQEGCPQYSFPYFSSCTISGCFPGSQALGLGHSCSPSHTGDPRAPFILVYLDSRDFPEATVMNRVPLFQNGDPHLKAPLWLDPKSPYNVLGCKSQAEVPSILRLVFDTNLNPGPSLLMEPLVC